MEFRRVIFRSVHKGKFKDAKEHDYIKTGILAPLIKWAGTFICYVSPQTKNSEWVNWEIEYAAKQGMRIVGVWQHGDQGCELPDALKEYADAMVGWNGDAIVDAITGKDGWPMPEGSPGSAVPLQRQPCGWGGYPSSCATTGSLRHTHFINSKHV